MKRILQAARRLAPDEDLILLATFEPLPLYPMMRLRGLRHQARRLPEGDWEVRFHHGAPDPAPVAAHEDVAPAEDETPAEGETTDVYLDNRGLQPPEPMMRTLEALGGLADGRVLEIHNDRPPQFLYPHLVERGYRYHVVVEPDESARVRIWRAR